MGATSDDLMEIARAGAERIDLPAERVRYPSFADIEEQCSAEYDELLNALRDDELFAPADLQRQEELVDNTARQLWMNQEAAFHLGMAVGLRLAQGRRH